MAETKNARKAKRKNEKQNISGESYTKIPVTSAQSGHFTAPRMSTQDTPATEKRTGHALHRFQNQGDRARITGPASYLDRYIYL